MRRTNSFATDDEGGFAGWVEKRLRYSRATAYRLLDVHEKLGDKASQIETLRRARSIFSPPIDAR
jgi:hypothetical protein